MTSVSHQALCLTRHTQLHTQLYIHTGHHEDCEYCTGLQQKYREHNFDIHACMVLKLTGIVVKNNVTNVICQFSFEIIFQEMWITTFID